MAEMQKRIDANFLMKASEYVRATPRNPLHLDSSMKAFFILYILKNGVLVLYVECT